MTGVSLRTFLTAVVLAAVSVDAGAQSAVCETVRPGDTASTVARRLTGRADSQDEPWFRVFDRSRSRVIPRPQYGRLQSGWQACVPTMRAVAHASATIPRTVSTPTRSLAQRTMSAAPSSVLDATSRSRAQELAFLLLGLAASGAAVICGWRSVEGIVLKRKALKRQMLAFGRAFLSDFERPLLVSGVVDRPVHARMRCVPRERRLDILLAPGAGRRYPNLADHRRNVEYDVCRITQHLRHHAFVPIPPRAEGPWVVIPFFFRPGPKTGAL